tara:strand:- start:1180 stop:1683 length:504 start_codon:yes stop_codon:yes gene_type:complete
MTERDFKATVLPLAERIYPMIARMLNNHHSAEDAVQEIMIRMWDSRSKLGDHPNLTGYVFLTARNYCLDKVRKKSLKLHSLNGKTDAIEAQKGSSDLERDELFAIIENLLKELPDQQGEVLKLRDIDGLEYGEIAEVMSLKVEHVRVLLSRARKTVSRQLKNIYNYE